jgi:hypothetical protein
MKILEETTQKVIVNYCKQNNILVAGYNGNSKNAIQGKINKDMGILKGYPDLFIPQFRLYLELKSKTGKPTSTQLEIHEKLRSWGYIVEIPRSAKEAVDIIKTFL